MQRQNNKLSTCGPYKVLRTLGEGGNAVIKLAEKDGEQFALKIMLLEDFNSETVLRKAKEEFEIVKALNLHGVMRYHDFEQDAVWTNAKGVQRKVAYLVMELIKGVELLEFINECDSLDDSTIRYIFLQIVNVI